MSKKLIALSAAAALALSALVAAPASATVFGLTITGGFGTGGSAAAATAINVPSSDTLGPWSPQVAANAAAVTQTALRVVVATTGATSAVSVKSTGAAKLVTTAQFDAVAPSAPTSATGAVEISGNAVSNSFTFYVTTTSSTAATYTVTEGSNVAVRWIIGRAGPAYSVTATAPEFVQLGIASDLIVKALDLFGNPVALLPVDATHTFLGAVQLATGTTTLSTFRTATGDNTLRIQGGTAFGPAAVSIGVAGPAARVAAANIAGFPGRSLTTFTSINSTNPVVVNTALQAQVTALTAQVAALQVTVDRRVTKKRFNTLARKWNAQNPSARVTLKK